MNLGIVQRKIRSSLGGNTREEPPNGFFSRRTSVFAETTETGGVSWAFFPWRAGPAKYGIAALPVLFTVVFARNLPSWVYMWFLAISIFAGAKWIVLSMPLDEVPRGRLAAFLFLWPGLNAERFLFHKGSLASLAEWLAAIGKTLLGAWTIGVLLRFLPASHPILVGWIGMVGVAFFLHFGAFHILSNIWRSAGFDASAIMTNPIRATSLARFWGGRWNKAYNDLMAPHLFRPLARSFGANAASSAVFLISGLLHELVISLPAGGGFGLPTAYFAIQAAGLIVERSQIGRRCRLGGGIRGWLFTMAITAGPAYWLFYPFFIHHVILPMLRAIGAI
jgi:hypothetical protein